MHDSTSRVFGLLVLLIAVWVGAYWLYDPTRPARVTRDDRPRDAVPTVPAPVLPEPRSLPRADPSPAPRPVDPQPAQPSVVVVPPEFDEYTVQPGDRSLQDIAQRFYGDRAKWEAIASANPFFSPDKLKPGVTVLRIPRDPSNIQGKVVEVRPPADEQAMQTDPAPVAPDPAAPPAGWRTYTVQESDTLWGIARKMYGRGTLTGLIADANRDVLPDPDRLRAGVVLRIPPAPAAD